MCGIAGFVTLSPSRIPDGVLHRMTDVLRHRGPDASGHHHDRYAALGHRRLSIVDLATGQQPMFNERRNLCLVFNGEIFNHAALRPDLERQGCRYATRSDTETILHAYERYGADCVSRLRGMFAFAVWDEVTRTLFCARDRLGIKPFYYYWDGRLFAFASEIKALLQHPAIAARFDDSLLPEYLAFGYTSGDRTLFAGIRKLMPGHHLRLSPDGLQIARYWDVPPAAEDRRSDDDWISECRRRLEDAVQTRLMSDVPLGVFLSGGVDSSSIAALMTRMMPEPVKSFSVGYREAAFSELTYASQLAAALGTEHRQTIVGMEQFFDALPKLIWHEDEPVAWPSSVSLYFVSKLAAEDVKVVLTGEGADEMFGGYARYGFYLRNRRRMERYGRVPPAIRGWIRARLADSTLLGPDLRRKLQHSVLGREPQLQSFYLDNFYSAFSAGEQLGLLSRSGGPSSVAYEPFLEYWRAAEPRGPLNRLLYADQKTYLVELLMKQDQMSMAASIESRVPFLDHVFVEFSAGVPDHLKVRGGSGKYILKQAVANLLPPEILLRKKMGFPTPLRTWLSGAGAVPILAALREPEGLLAEHLDRRALLALLDDHERGRIDATDRIWRLLNLQLWGRIFVNGDRESRLATALPA